MATTSRPAADLLPAQRLRDAIARALARPDDILWSRVALAAVTMLAGILYLWDLTVSGYANEYYAMAAQAASQSWSAWFFGSLDASNFITLDKPPAATMLMGLSVRLLGLSSLSILLPQALLGIGTVALLFVIVRRSFGTAAATVAGVVMALTPVAVLMFRFDNPDALLTFVFVAGAGTLLAAIESGRRRWLVATGLLLGVAFLTKYLEAFVVVPGFALAYLVAGRGSVRRRIVDLLALGAISLAASGWWVVIVEATPASSRPYIGGSTGNSVLDLIFGYDGLGRIFGMLGFGAGPAGAPPAGAGGGGSPFGGTPGVLRLFNSEFAGGISWFLPLSVAGLAAGLWAHRRADRRDPRLAAYLLWGGWLVVTVAVFSLMSGIIHPYYTVALAPAVAALVGAGGAELWRLGRGSVPARIVVAATIVASAGWAAVLLSSTPSFVPGLGFAVLAVAVAAALVLLLPSASIGASLPRAAAAAALVALLAGPTAYAGATIGSAHGGGDPSSGPVGQGAQGGPGGAGSTGGGLGGAFGGGIPPNGPVLPNGGAFPGAFPGGVAGFGGPGGATLSQSVIDYLVAHQGSARWLVAVSSSNEAAPIQLATGIPVMATGGFSGSDAALSLEQLKAYVASGQLRFIVAGGRGFGGGTSGISSWVTSSCTAVTADGSQTSVYDCAGAAGG